jgi:hypothetical protein
VFDPTLAALFLVAVIQTVSVTKKVGGWDCVATLRLLNGHMYLLMLSAELGRVLIGVVLGT